jgi:hypothetical protein
MKTKIIVLIALLIPVLFSSCEKIKGKGDVITQTRVVTGYTSIELAIEGDVSFTQDSVYTLSISAQENIADNIETDISGTSLVIKKKDNVVFGKHDPINITITAPSVTDLILSGSGNFTVSRIWSGNFLTTNISGSGNMYVNNIFANQLNSVISGSGNMTINSIDGNKINATISGSGNIETKSGISNEEYLKISGSGNIDMRYVETDTAYATISGSGDIYINVKKLLDATISGSGNIYYLGNPVIDTHISGSGNVTRL